MNFSIRRWKWAYFGLAFLSFFGFCAILFLNHQLQTQNSDSVRVNKFWAEQLRTIEELQVLAGLVNAPGNDIFESNKETLEEQRLRSAIEDYEKKFSAAVTNIRSNLDIYPLNRVLSLFLETEGSMKKMIFQSAGLFQLLKQGNKKQAVAKMAEMDRSFRDLTEVFIKCSQEVRENQKKFLDNQKTRADEFEKMGAVVFVLISFVLVGLFVYGLFVSRFFSQALEDKVLLDEQRRALNAAAIVAITDLDGTIKYSNSKFEEISGYRKEELIGKTHRLVNSDYHSKEFFEAMWSAIKKGEVWKGEIRNRKKDGSLYWVDSTVVPMRDPKGKVWQYASVRFDITARKLAEEQLIQAQARLEDAELTGRFGSWELDLKTMKGLWSAGHNHLFEFDEKNGEPSFETFLAMVIPEDQSKPKAVIDDIYKKGLRFFDLDYRIRLKNGSLRHIKGYGKVLVDVYNQPLKIIGTVQDFTNLKAMEEKLIASREEALEASRIKSVFLANMSHEIRTPMNGIIGMTNLLLSSAADPQQVERLEIIKNCGNSLMDLINDLLDFSKFEANKVDLEKRPFGLHTMIREVVELFGPRASEKGLVLSYNAGEGVPNWFLGDVTRFRQVVSNLISNALKFTENGRVDIESKAEKLSDKSWRIHVSVKDTGIGIPEDVKSRLFQSFSQVDASTTRRFGGSGLGLAISKGICEKMGGGISVESQVGQGSIFRFSILADEAQSQNSEASSNPFSGLDFEMGKNHPLRILLAEDNRTNQLVAQGVLGKLGYKIDLAINGLEVLEKMQHKTYDLILMDCHMPEMDGFETTRQIMKLYTKGNRPRVVALTASTMKQDVEKCLAAGMEEFIGKPIQIPVLIEVLKRCPSGKVSRKVS